MARGRPAKEEPEGVNTRSRSRAPDPPEGSPRKASRSRRTTPAESYHRERLAQESKAYGEYPSISSDNELSEAPILKPTRARRVKTVSPERRSKVETNPLSRVSRSIESPRRRQDSWSRLQSAYQDFKSRRLSETNEERVQKVEGLLSTTAYNVIRVLAVVGILTATALFFSEWSGTPELGAYEISSNLSSRNSVRPWLEWLLRIPTRGKINTQLGRPDGDGVYGVGRMISPLGHPRCLTTPPDPACFECPKSIGSPKCVERAVCEPRVCNLPHLPTLRHWVEGSTRASKLDAYLGLRWPEAFNNVIETICRFFISHPFLILVAGYLSLVGISAELMLLQDYWKTHVQKLWGKVVRFFGQVKILRAKDVDQVTVKIERPGDTDREGLSDQAEQPQLETTFRQEQETSQKDE